MEKPEVKSHQKKKRKEDSCTFEDSSVGEPREKAAGQSKNGSVSDSRVYESDVDEATDLDMVDTSDIAKPFIPVYSGDEYINPDVLPKGPVLFLDNLSGQASKELNGALLNARPVRLTLENSRSRQFDYEEIKQTVPMEKPEVKSHQKKKRKEDSSTSEDSPVGEPCSTKNGSVIAPAKKEKAGSRMSDSRVHESDMDEATDLEMVDTCHKAKPFIPVYLGVTEPINPDVLPRGPVVFVGNLSPQVKYSDVENLFKDCGEIRNIRFILNIYHSFDGQGFVEFKNREAAEKALKLNNRRLKGHRVHLMLGNPWGPQFEFKIRDEANKQLQA